MKHIKTADDFNKHLLFPLIKHIECSLLPLENLLLEHFLKELKIDSLMHLVASLFIDKDKAQKFDTGINILVEKNLHNTIFNETVAEYYKKGHTDTKIDLFFDRLSLIVSDFFIQTTETATELKKVSFFAE